MYGVDGLVMVNSNRKQTNGGCMNEHNGAAMPKGNTSMGSTLSHTTNRAEEVTPAPPATDSEDDEDDEDDDDDDDVLLPGAYTSTGQ